jgi:hypothetical protein
MIANIRERRAEALESADIEGSVGRKELYCESPLISASQRLTKP